MPAGFRQDREETARGYANVLRREFDVVDAGMLVSDADGDRANTLLREARPDVVVFAPSMAAPPSYAARALAGLDVAARRLERPDDRPAPGRAHPVPGDDQLVAGRRRDARERARATAAAVRDGHRLTLRPGRHRAARPHRARRGRRIRAARMRRCSASAPGFPGYLDVESTSAELARLGVREHAVSVEELDDAFAAVDAARIAPGLEALAARGWDHREGEADARSMRLALALADLAVGDGRGRRHRQLPLRGAALEPGDRDHRLPRRLAADGGGHPRLLHGRPPDGARARARPRPSPAGRSTASSTRPSARPA